MTTLPDLPPACDRLDAAIASDLVIRGTWTRDEGGRHLACLLATLVPECGVHSDAAACPATVMPGWLAELTPWLDDSGSVEAWPAMIREFARLLRASQNLTADAWSRLDYQYRAIAVREARSRVPPDSTVLPAVDGVLLLLDRAAAGDLPTDREWHQAQRRVLARPRRPGSGRAEHDLREATIRVTGVGAQWSWTWNKAWAAGEGKTAAEADAAWAAAEAAVGWVESAAVESAAWAVRVGQSDQITEKFFAVWASTVLADRKES